MGDYETALLEAVEGGHLEKIKELLNSNLSKLNDERYLDYYLIIKALDSHYVEVAKLLIETGFRVYKESKSNQERTVLHAATACMSKDKDLIRNLLSKGASLDILYYDEKKITPFHIAIDGYRLLTIKLFLSEYDTKCLDEQYFLHYAILQGKTEVVSQLIKKGLSIKKRNEENLTPYCIALENKNFTILDILLSEYSMKNSVSHSSDDIAVVCIAIICGNLNIVKKYAGSGLPIDVPLKVDTNTWPCLDKFSGLTFLYLAVKHNMLEIVKFLLSIGANTSVQDVNGSTPLHLAFETKEKDTWKTLSNSKDNDDDEMVDLVLSAPNATNSNPINSEGLSHFHVACTTNNVRAVKSFIENGVDLDSCITANGDNHCLYDYSGYSTLHFAVSRNRAKTILLLLQKGANIDIRNSHGETPTDLAYQNTLGILEEYCFDEDESQFDRNTVFHNIALGLFQRNEIASTVSTLVNIGFNINSQNSKGITALHLACEKQNYCALEVLLLHGADINIEDNEGSTVCCYLYKTYLQNLRGDRDSRRDVQRMMNILQKQIIKMTVIGIPMSKKVSMSNSKFDRFKPLTDKQKIKLIRECQTEVQILKGTKIHANCTLYNGLMKDENTLAQIVNNPVFEDILFSKTFNKKYLNYSYFIDLKYQTGVVRMNLLPAAKRVLNDLADLPLPDICSENICKFFTNVELKETIEILRNVLDLKTKNLGYHQFRQSKTGKRQKVN